MPLLSKWLTYVDRSYEQIKAAIITNRMPTETPELTDHTESHAFIRMIGMFAGMMEQLGYYVDHNGRESHIQSCRLFASAVKIAFQHDYRIKCSHASTGFVTIVTSASWSWTTATRFKTDSNIEFRPLEAGSIVGAGTVVIEVVNEYDVAVPATGTSDGTKFFEIQLDDKKYKAKSAAITSDAGATIWTRKDSLFASTAVDNHYVEDVNSSGFPVFRFGDGVFGARPVGGTAFSITYKLTDGDGGNLTVNAVTSFVGSTPIEVVSISNLTSITGGASIENLEDVRRRLPMFTRTLERAVTKQDYKDLLNMINGVAAAGVEFTCGSPVKIFIAPEGSGLASTDLIDEVDAYMADRIILGTTYTVSSAGIIGIRFEITVYVLPTYVASDISLNVRDNIIDYLSIGNQDVGGAVYLSDIYEVIENTPGVDHSNIEVMNPQPYARQISGTEVAINWIVEILEGSVTNIKWRINFVTATTYQLSKDSGYIGTFAVGDLYTDPDNIVQFQINSGSYVTGVQYEFWTYPFFGDLVLAEQSVPYTDATLINITTEGGV